MSIVVHDYKCPRCGLVEERWVKRSKMNHQFCEDGERMLRLPSAPHLDYVNAGVDPDFGTLGDKWAKMQEQKVSQGQTAPA
jgi:hypothetical protein